MAPTLPFKPPRPRLEQREDGTLLFWQDYPVAPMFSTMAHLFVQRANEVPDRVMVAERVADGWRAITYGQMLARARRVASGLQMRGVAAGHRIVILSGASVDHVALTMGAMLARAIVVPVSEAYSLSSDRGRLAYVLDQIEPALVFAEGQQFDAAAANLGPSIEVVRDLGEFETSTSLDVDGALASIEPDTVFKILWTSGSTALPRAVIQTHRMCSASLAFEASLSTHPTQLREPHVVLDWLPWSHVGGSITMFLTVLLAGGSLYLDDGRPVPGKFDATIRNIKDFPPEIFSSPPIGCAMLNAAMDGDPYLREQFFSRLIYVKSGAAGMPEDVRQRFQHHSRATTGHETPILMGYGTTETHGVISVFWDTQRPNLLGLPKPGVIVKLVPSEYCYELRIKSASVTPGYFRDPAATAASLDEEGFWQTGDTALVDLKDLSEGLVFAGRLGGNFKMPSGTWVPVEELQRALTTRLEVLVSDCLVVGEGRGSLGLIVWKKNDLVSSNCIAESIRAFNRDAKGASRRISRLIVSASPIQSDRFERTEKGTLNRKLIMANRTHEVERLYSEPLLPGDDVFDLTIGN